MRRSKTRMSLTHPRQQLWGGRVAFMSISRSSRVCRSCIVQRVVCSTCVDMLSMYAALCGYRVYSPYLTELSNASESSRVHIAQRVVCSICVALPYLYYVLCRYHVIPVRTWHKQLPDPNLARFRMTIPKPGEVQDVQAHRKCSTK